MMFQFKSYRPLIDPLIFFITHHTKMAGYFYNPGVRLSGRSSVRQFTPFLIDYLSIFHVHVISSSFAYILLSGMSVMVLLMDQFIRFNRVTALLGIETNSVWSVSSLPFCNFTGIYNIKGYIL